MVLFLGSIKNEFIIKDELYFQTLGEQLAHERVEQILDLKKKWDWIAYAIIPFVLFIKFLLVAVCLETGTIFYGFRVGFRQLFHAAMVSEVVFCFAQVIKTIFVAFSKMDDLFQLQYLGSFSLLSIWNNPEMDSWFVHPLLKISIFEIAYWFVMAYVLKILIGKNYSIMVRFVLSTYGLGLLVWIILVMFITVHIS